jgi:hypothetical protein
MLLTTQLPYPWPTLFHGTTGLPMEDKTRQASLNRDPITGTPGAHPLGVGS